MIILPFGHVQEDGCYQGRFDLLVTTHAHRSPHRTMAASRGTMLLRRVAGSLPGLALLPRLFWAQVRNGDKGAGRGHVL